MAFSWKAAGISTRDLELIHDSYNRYLAISGRAVRRSLKEDKRIIAERRGQSELKFAKWENGKQGESRNLAEATAAGMSSEKASS